MMSHALPGVLLTLLFVSACGFEPSEGAATERVTERPAPATPAEHVSTPSSQGHATADAGVKAPSQDGAQMELLSTGTVIGARPISPRSMSVKVFFKGGGEAVFKPIRRDDRTARCEVAYYRLATALGVGGVPPSTMRRLPVARLVGHLERNFEETAARFASEVKVDDRGMVSGATIDWVDDIGPSGLDGPGGWSMLASLLAIDGPAPGDEPLVRQASDMVVLDHVLGNWDRYSGGNLFASSDGNLILLDNNGAFAPWSQGQRDRTSRTLGLCKRFSRKLIEHLRSLDEKRVRAAIQVGPGEKQLLTDKEVMRIFERRDQLISTVDNLIAVHGRENVLSLP